MISNAEAHTVLYVVTAHIRICQTIGEKIDELLGETTLSKLFLSLSEKKSVLCVGPLQHHSQSPVTSYYIRSLRIDLLHSSSFLSPALFFFVSFCVICFSVFPSYVYL